MSAYLIRKLIFWAYNKESLLYYGMSASMNQILFTFFGDERSDLLSKRDIQALRCTSKTFNEVFCTSCERFCASNNNWGIPNMCNDCIAVCNVCSSIFNIDSVLLEKCSGCEQMVCFGCIDRCGDCKVVRCHNCEMMTKFIMPQSDIGWSFRDGPSTCCQQCIHKNSKRCKRCKNFVLRSGSIECGMCGDNVCCECGIFCIKQQCGWGFTCKECSDNLMILHIWKGKFENLKKTSNTCKDC